MFLPVLPHLWSNYPSDTQRFGYTSPLELLLSIGWIGWNVFITPWTIAALIIDLVILFLVAHFLSRFVILFSFFQGLTLGLMIQFFPLLLFMVMGQHPFNLSLDLWLYNLFIGFGIPLFIAYSSIRKKSIGAGRAFYIGAFISFVILTFLLYWNLTFYPR